MEYIEISDGISVRICEIEAVKKNDEMTSSVITHQNTYASTFPYNVLLDLLNMASEEKETNEIEQEKLNIMKTQGFFAG